MAIGFFDSGIGGVTVLAAALKRMPREDYLYFADSLHVPYGPKPKETVRGYIFEAVDYLAGRGIDALVVACNTATSVAINDLRSRYAFPIIGMEPAVKPAVKNTVAGKRVLALATALTIQGTKYQDLVAAVDPEHIIDSMPMPELVEYAEQLMFDETVIVPFLRRKFAELDLTSYGSVVLGCTHFEFFRHSLRQVLTPQAQIVTGTDGTLRQLARKLEEAGYSRGAGSGNIAFCSSAGEADAARLEQAFAVAQTMIQD